MSGQPAPPADLRRPRSPGDAFDELAPLATGSVAGLCMMPGFFLCAPGILLLVVTPLIVLTLVLGVVAVLGLVLATPVLVLKRIAHAWRHMDAEPMPGASIVQLGPPARR